MTNWAGSSATVEERLREFASRLLQRRGAEVEWPADADQGLALLPADVAQTLHCLEILPLGADSESPLPVNLTSDFLDRVEPLVSAGPQVVHLQVPDAYLKRSDMAEPVARAFAWLNARVRVQSAEPTRLEYHTWYFLATLDSADRWQQVIRVCVNAATGAEVALPDLLDAGTVLELEPGDLPAEHPSTQLAAVRAALGHVHALSRAFVQRVEGRLGRDRQRLQDYYRALLRGDSKRSARRGTATDWAEQRAKAKAVQLELRRKLAELDERYACRLDLTPLALARMECPALAVHCDVLRRSTAGTFRVFWNALTKELEPLCCSRCGTSTFSVAFSDNKLATFCAACQR
jgi:hypothetical protein